MKSEREGECDRKSFVSNLNWRQNFGGKFEDSVPVILIMH